MQLTYRGVSYEFNPPKVEMTNTSILAKFRNAAYPVRHHVNPPIASSKVILCYRGVIHSSTPSMPKPQDWLGALEAF